MISESMMITPDDLIIHVDRDGLQKEVSLSRDCSEAGWQVVSWILLLAFFEEWGDIYFLLVLRHLS